MTFNYIWAIMWFSSQTNCKLLEDKAYNLFISLPPEINTTSGRWPFEWTKSYTYVP